MKKLVLSKGTRYVHGRNEETTASQFFPIDAVFFSLICVVLFVRFYFVSSKKLKAQGPTD